MNPILDNMIWQAISTGNSSLASISGDVGAFHPDIAPFAAMQQNSPAAFERLHAFLEPGRKVAISYFEKPELPAEQWSWLKEMDCCQMLHGDSNWNNPPAEMAGILPLGREHIPQMLELTRLTQPGPFFPETIQFGNYFGIFSGEQLVAMTGQRMHPVPYLEVSAVCTHPDHRGRGYARALMLKVMGGIREQGYIPFLHVLAENKSAIALYESLGFRTRTRIHISMIRRN